ncbi:MAG: S9 family peptidase, partial [candidate division KSB1 bacterium]|nr:S9 family peptidase [candidate division KSB1 bacterium]
IRGTAWALLLLGLLGRFTSAGASESKASITVPLSNWLQLGPLASPWPIFHEVKNIKGQEFGLKQLLQFDPIDIQQWWPQTGDTVRWDQATRRQWQRLVGDSTGVRLASATMEPAPAFYYLLTYLDAQRWLAAKLEVKSEHPFQVFLDGKMVGEKTGSDKPSGDSVQAHPGKISAELKLETGKHRLLVKLLADPENKFPLRIFATLTLTEPFSAADLQIDLQPTHHMTITHLLEGPKLGGVSISPDGELAAISIRKSLPPSDDTESWIELRRIGDGRLVQTFRGGMAIDGIQWAPIGKRFSYITSGKEGSTLWLVDLESGTSEPVLEKVKDFVNYSWAPNGRFIVYSIAEKAEQDKSGLKKLEGMADRLPGWRQRSFLYLVTVPEKSRKRLTSGFLSTNLNSISPDSKRLLFSRSMEDYSHRPYSKTQLFVLALESMKLDTLWTLSWFGSAQWSPDGKQLLVTGGPSLFGKLGVAVPDTVIPNDYDTQAYVYDLATQTIDPISRNFDPAMGQAVWSQFENAIYFNTTDRSYRHLYRYDLKTRRYEKLDTGVEVLNSFDLAKTKPIMVYTGSGAVIPNQALVLDLKSRKYRLLANNEREDFEKVAFGRVESWSFRNRRNVAIDGYVYYPPNFDPANKYPLIVYYYGGTSPVSRDFEGRYPKNLYAAQGYVVYVLQPSGATGFGQEFSALHVNDWGRIVVDEIVDGVKQFLVAHPFVDDKRVGCIGASYGGFTTMLLQTRTDMFAAAVAHAGISSIASYWGEGYWGYLYSAVATANSFPWNRKDIYVDQSPLFQADRIKTPLLLLHGSEDTNVPPGESIQLYTALKLLGREVELIQVEDQNHTIMTYSKRILWTKSILAWFDKWLKGEPEWWNELYPKLGQ